MGIIPRRSVHSRFLLTLVVSTGFGFGFLFAGGDALILSWIRSAQAVITCDNDGTVDAGETCSNCPFDVRCTAAQKCIAGACSSASWSCKREDVCGDGWVSDFEECDNGGICTGSTNAGLNGKLCFDLDPARPAGVARCRATGGICVAQDGDGCTSDCQTECKEDAAPCLLASDCCGSSCTDGVCGAGGGGGGGGSCVPSKDAIDLLGQLDGGNNPDYTTTVSDNGDTTPPNNKGFNFTGGGNADFNELSTTLWVADTANNRVLGFTTDGDYTFDASDRVADFVLGQTNLDTNAPGTLDTQMDTPTDIVAGQDMVIVADSGNNRVLIFDLTSNPLSEPGTDNPAQYVLGQTDFGSKTTGNALNQMNNPRGVGFDDSINLYVVDTGNNRVLGFNGIPGANNANAQYVLGQTGPGQSSPSVSATGMNAPEDVTGGMNDAWTHRIFIADTGNNRVMVFNTSDITEHGVAAAAVLGQPDKDSSDAATSQAGMDTPRGVHYLYDDGDNNLPGHLYVADTENNRVLVYDLYTGAISDGQDAVGVFGQPDFTSKNFAWGQDGLRGPTGVAGEHTDVPVTRSFIVDGGNHRVMVHDECPKI